MESSRPKPEAYVANIWAQKNQGSKRKFKGGRGKEKIVRPRNQRLINKEKFCEKEQVEA